MHFFSLGGRNWVTGKLSELRRKQAVDIDALASRVGMVCPTDGSFFAYGHAARKSSTPAAVEFRGYSDIVR